MHQDPAEGAVTPQEIELALPVCPGVSGRVWVNSGLLHSQGTEYNSACTSPSEGGRHYLHYPYHSLASGQTTGREHSPTQQRKIGLKIY